jgi:hypothetical protein
MLLKSMDVWNSILSSIRGHIYSTLFFPHLFHHKVLLDRESWFNVFLRRSFPSAILFSSLAPWFPGKFNYLYIYIYIYIERERERESGRDEHLLAGLRRASLSVVLLVPLEQFTHSHTMFCLVVIARVWPNSIKIIAPCIILEKRKKRDINIIIEMGLCVACKHVWQCNLLKMKDLSWTGMASGGGEIEQEESFSWSVLGSQDWNIWQLGWKERGPPHLDVCSTLFVISFLDSSVVLLS